MTLSLVSSETFINLIERKVDVAIRVGTLTDSSLRARPLFTSYRKIIASPDYIARYGTPVNAEDLADHLCPGFTEPVSLNTRPIAASDGQLLEVGCEITSNSGETLKQLCLGGNGIACLSDYMVDKEIASGEFVELLADKRLPVEMPFSAVYYSDRAVSTRIRAFIDFLSEHVKQLPEGAVRNYRPAAASTACRNRWINPTSAPDLPGLPDGRCNPARQSLYDLHHPASDPALSGCSPDFSRLVEDGITA